MSKRYVAVKKANGHVLSSPSEFREPDTNQLACSIWSWVPDPEGIKGHHFDSRAQAKEVIRAIGTDISQVSFRKAA